MSINLGHLWLLPTSSEQTGMANVLGFDYEDLMAMFQALGLVGYVNDLFKVIKHDNWSVKLALPIPYTMD
jgi:hypothetical protein